MTGKKQDEGDVGEVPTLIVFGLDETRRPHASTFPAHEAELAEKAAGLMGMAALRLATDAQKALAAKLPKGRVFASGRAFVPFVRAELYEAIVRAAGGLGQTARSPVRPRLTRQRPMQAWGWPGPRNPPRRASRRAGVIFRSAASCSPRPAPTRAGTNRKSSKFSTTC
jgi:hypothetical protein